jgi:hypothetical protein
MNSVAVQEKRFIRLAPSNNSTTGYSPVGSQPIIRFSIADTQAHALMKDARINARVKVVRTGTTPVAQTDDFNIDPVVGMCSVFDQIVISSRRFGSTIEQVNNMSRLDSAYYRTKFSPKDMNSHSYMKTRSVGVGRYNRFNGTTASSTTEADLRLIAQRKKLITTASASPSPKDEDLMEISLPLHAGFFLTDEQVDLSQVGGVELAIYLAKPEAVFFGTGTNAPTSASSYTLLDVSLTVPLLYKSAEQIAQTPAEGQIEFLNWTSLFSVMDSTVSSIAHRLYLSGLVSMIHNLLPTSEMNSVSANQMALKHIGVERLTFLRDGVRAPLEKTTITDKKSSTRIEATPCMYPEVITDYLSALKAPRDLKHTQVIPELLKGVNDRVGVMGLGANFDPESAGINLSGVLSLDCQSKLEDTTSGDGSETRPHALFSFYLSRQAFLTSPQGLTQV